MAASKKPDEPTPEENRYYGMVIENGYWVGRQNGQWWFQRPNSPSAKMHGPYPTREGALQAVRNDK